jgi:hypothetical protein
VKIKLLEPHGGLKAGAEWNCPVAALARKLIEEGKALALEACDLHLNPKGAPAPKPAKAKSRKAPAAPKAARPLKALRLPAAPKPAKAPKTPKAKK